MKKSLIAMMMLLTLATTAEASGVGLYLSREIIQNHGGDISVKSVKDEYSEFTFNIPFK